MPIGQRMRVESAPADCQALCQSRVRHDAGDGRQLRHGEFLDAASRSRRQGARHAAWPQRPGSGTFPRRSSTWTRAWFCTRRRNGSATFGSLVPAAALLAGPRQGDAQGSQGFQAHRPKSAASRRAGQVRRHRAVHLGHGISRHAGGVAQATAAVRRDGQSFDATGPRPCRAWSRSCRSRAASPWSRRASGPPSRDATRSSSMGRNQCREAQLRRHDGGISAARRAAGPLGAQGRRRGRRSARCDSQGLRQLRISVSGARAHGAPRRGGQAYRRRCEIWAGDQFQTVDQANAAQAAGLDPQQVSIHTLYAGGSFGRRANVGPTTSSRRYRSPRHYGADGTPIKLQWTREDDIHGGLYRPMYFHKLEAGLNAQGELTGWQHVIVGQSIMAGTPFAAMMIKDGIDPTSVEGAANIAYDIPNIAVDLCDHQDRRAGAVVARGRQLAYHVCGGELHRRGGARGGRGSVRIPAQDARQQAAHEAVLELAAEKAGWDGPPLPKGKGRGIAVAEAFKTFVAQVAEVSVDDGGQRQGRSRGVRRRLRHAHQSRHHHGADGRRHRLRPGGGAVRRDHAEGRPCRAGQLQQLPGACA